MTPSLPVPANAHLIHEVADFVPQRDAYVGDDGAIECEMEPAHFAKDGKVVVPTFTLPCLHDDVHSEAVVVSALALGAAHGLTAHQTLTLWARANFLQVGLVVS